MARFIPKVKPEDFNNSYGEMKVYEALRSLDDNYTVFYSLSWVGINDQRTLGEADFVVAHPDKGIFVIEVKSGEIEYKQGEWIQTNTRSKVSKPISPFVQARKSQFELLDRLHKGIREFRIPMMCYGVWFPSITIMDDVQLPPEAPKEITLDQKDLESPAAAIVNAFLYWARKYPRKTHLDSWQFQKVIDVLCPHFHVVPRLKTKIEELDDAYIMLTRQQSALLDFLEEQRTAAIHGVAGTGKTVLAVEKVKRLAAQNRQVLFLCYNSFLKDTLKDNNIIPNVTFHNVHSLAYEVMGQSNQPLEKVVGELELYLKEMGAGKWKYTDVIVDEGQDLSDQLLEMLSSIVKQKDGCFYVFYDKNQYIMKNQLPGWIDAAECRLVLHKNCRNTAEVFKTSCSIMGLEHVVYNEIHGETPTIKFYSSQTDEENIVTAFIENALREGLTPSDVVILTTKTLENTWIDFSKTYAGQTLSPDKQDDKILFTTIRKFKGLEAEAVLIVDAQMSRLTNWEERRLLYTGSSRAKNLLNIAMMEDISRDDYGDYLRSIAPDRNVPKNKKGLKRLLNVDL